LTLGVETAFNAVNDAGGVGAHRLKLVSADDGYEPSRTTDLVKRLAEKDGVVGFVASFGTPTVAAALPYMLERKLLLLGALTGSNALRSVPPDRYVFNYRPSYAEETEAAVRYLVNVRGLKPADIAVFAQDDDFGESGYAGVVKAVRALQGGRYTEPPLKLTYKRNTIDVSGAVAALRARKVPPKAIVMTAVYRPAAEFIKATRPTNQNLIYTNVSAVGSTALADELALMGPKIADGVIVTQVVPAVNGHSKIVLDFKAALAKYFPGEQPDYVSLESYVVAKILIEAVRRATAIPGVTIDGDRLADALEGIGELDLGLGAPLKLGPGEHQASHVVWGTQLDATGKYKAIDLQ
jgi:ABC-type branched-subunit amino acid transport system substrate-binding protein